MIAYGWAEMASNVGRVLGKPGTGFPNRGRGGEAPRKRVPGVRGRSAPQARTWGAGAKRPASAYLGCGGEAPREHRIGGAGAKRPASAHRARGPSARKTIYHTPPATAD